MSRGLLVLALLAVAAGQDLDFDFDPDLVELEEPSWWELYGRADLSLQYSDGLEALRERRSRHALAYAVALSLHLEPTGWFRFVAEAEVEGVADDDFSEAFREVPGDDSLLEVGLDQLFVAFGPEDCSLALGWNYVPFGLERRYYSSVRNRFVDRPTPFQVIYPGTYADTGLFFAWQPGPVDLELAVSSGLQGPARNDRPDLLTWRDPPPQLSGRLGVELVEGLELGASGLYGWMDASFDEELWLVGVDARLEVGRWSLRGEAIFGRVDPSIERYGFYLEAVYTQPVHWDWLVRAWYGARFDAAHPDRDTPRLERTQRGSLVLGLGFTEHVFAKLQAEVVDLIESEKVGGGVQLQVGISW